MKPKHSKDTSDWHAILHAKHAEPLAFQITRQGATEPPHTGKWLHHKKTGLYRCICCDAPLFSSATKFDSGSGWPSYFQALDNGAITTQEDTQFAMVRTEIHCTHCGAHLGHLFPDGPAPTGLRYCVNSASLHFTDETTD